MRKPPWRTVEVATPVDGLPAGVGRARQWWSLALDCGHVTTRPRSADPPPERVRCVRCERVTRP